MALLLALVNLLIRRVSAGHGLVLLLLALPLVTLQWSRTSTMISPFPGGLMGLHGLSRTVE